MSQLELFDLDAIVEWRAGGLFRSTRTGFCLLKHRGKRFS